ncbi:hypothetical protein QR680_005801 [Steinernema hermaphroditum]|uniref:Amino acid transporter transmembrane domain-containing protein n=1 Tax=Steinernema hermaphroditum TaxID=289476 RepID=A0AA39HVQ8_9BILA|nr:hypothetical protein QR680_005801 [Steinernema hermaphroditum]
MDYSKSADPYFTRSSRGTSAVSSEDSEDIRRGRFQNKHGLHWIITGLFVVGDMAGGGLVALPTAMIQSQFWPGIILLLVMTVVTAYTAYILGESWVIMQKRWPEYRQHCRKPYAEMGQRAMGPRIKAIVSICIDATQFGIATVYLLLSAKNIHDSIKAFSNNSVDLNFCFVILIVAAFLLPVTFLKSPQDFWWAVVLAMVTTTVAVVLMVVGGIIDYGTCNPHREMPGFSITQYFLALGTLLFSYGGHAAFPTIQHDMKKPYHFKKSVALSFITVDLLYIPVCIVGYITYGDSLRDSIINSIQTNWIQQAINILITVHCILTLTIVFNPLNQEAEEIFNVPQHFCLKRVLVRTGMMVAVVFVAESLPTFGPLLDLMGGSTLTLTSLVFPSLFYMYLLTSEKKREEGYKTADEIPSVQEVLQHTPRITLVFCCFVIVFGLFGGGAATFSAIRELSTTQFQYPCYVAPFLNVKGANSDDGHTACCGHFSNVTWAKADACMKFVKFYN